MTATYGPAKVIVDYGSSNETVISVADQFNDLQVSMQQQTQDLFDQSSTAPTDKVETGWLFEITLSLKNLKLYQTIATLSNITPMVNPTGDMLLAFRDRNGCSLPRHKVGVIPQGCAGDDENVLFLPSACVSPANNQFVFGKTQTSMQFMIAGLTDPQSGWKATYGKISGFQTVLNPA